MEKQALSLILESGCGTITLDLFSLNTYESTITKTVLVHPAIFRTGWRGIQIQADAPQDLDCGRGSVSRVGQRFDRSFDLPG